MMCRRFLQILVSFFVLILLLVQISCEKFSGDQTVPAYIRIDSIRLTTDYSSQGTARHSITDAWVYVDGEIIGTFQLPAKFPVLKQGTHSMTVLPGIKKDGIAATRVSYDFYKPITKTLNLTPDSTINEGILSTGYSTSAVFMWKEDFDDVAVTLDSMKEATTMIHQTPSGSPLTLEGLHSGVVALDTAGATFSAVSHSTYQIPFSLVYLEMNFNTTTTFSMGVYVTASGITYQLPVVGLLPTGGKWKKIYIDLSTALNTYTGASAFRVYFYCKQTAMSNDMILIDNIKMLSF
jgi:hypothetical protein